MIPAAAPVSGSSNAPPDNRTISDLVATIVRPRDVNSAQLKALALESLERAAREYNLADWNCTVSLVQFTIADNDNDGSQDDVYDLPQAYNRPRAMWRLSSTTSLEYHRLQHIPSEEFLDVPSLTVTGTPRYYTLINQFADGKIRFYPRPGDSLAGTIYRHYYYRRILVPHDMSQKLNVDSGVEEGIAMWARYLFLSSIPGTEAARQAASARADAAMYRERLYEAQLRNTDPLC